MVPPIIRHCARCGHGPTPRQQRYCSRVCYLNGPRRDLSERFWEKVDKDGPCWLWTASRNALGYGEFNLNGAVQLAHRVAWQLTHGPIPDGLLICHHCDHPPCCNPAHLFLGTKLDNRRDMVAKGRERILHGAETYLRQHPERIRRGEQLPWAKLTADDVRVIRASFATGTTRRDLATRYGIGRSTIDHIVHRRSWKHVE